MPGGRSLGQSGGDENRVDSTRSFFSQLEAFLPPFPLMIIFFLTFLKSGGDMSPASPVNLTPMPKPPGRDVK